MAIGMYTIENGLLIIPILFLYMNAIERHQFLESTIGSVTLEKEALNTIWILVTYSLTTVLSLPVIQIVLLWAYNIYGHPWKRFLTRDIPAIDKTTIERTTNISIEYDEIMKQGDGKKTIDTMPVNALLKVTGHVECKSIESRSAKETMHETTKETSGATVNVESIELSRLEIPRVMGPSLVENRPENEVLFRVESCDVTEKDDTTVIKLQCTTEEQVRQTK